jgi:ADP-heptose:LPS heptosyltransferase
VSPLAEPVVTRAWTAVEDLTVVRAGALGDFVVTLPALRALAPGRRLRLVGNAAAARALAPELFATIDSIDDSRWSGLFGGPLEAVPEAAVVLARDPGIGDHLSAAGAAPVLWAPSFPTQPGVHVADHLLEAAAPAALEAPLFPALPRIDVARPAVGRPYAVVHPGSGSPHKNWPPARFAAVAKALRSQGLDVVALGGPADEAALAAFAIAAPDVVIRADLNLRAAAELAAGAMLYVGNDAGMSHVAAAAGAPTIAIFGPTRAARWAPRGRRVRLLEPSERCARCVGAEERPAACRCIERVLLETVLATVDELLLEGMG